MTQTTIKITGGVWINDPTDMDESLVENVTSASRGLPRTRPRLR